MAAGGMALVALKHLTQTRQLVVLEAFTTVGQAAHRIVTNTRLKMPPLRQSFLRTWSIV